MNETRVLDNETVRRALATLRRGTGARCVLLVGRGGQVMAQSGNADGVSLEAVLPALAEEATLTSRLGHHLEGGVGLSLHDYEGDRYHFYAAVAAGGPSLLAVVGQHASSQRAGLVWLFLRRALEGLRGLSGAEGGEVTPPTDAALAVGSLTTAQARALGLLSEADS